MYETVSRQGGTVRRVQGDRAGGQTPGMSLNRQPSTRARMPIFHRRKHGCLLLTDVLSGSPDCGSV